MKHPRATLSLSSPPPCGRAVGLGLLGLALFTGCSTHPIVDTRDCLFPGRLTKEEVPPYGGVCRPQGAVAGLATPATVAPPTPPGPVVPPPVPLPPPTTTPPITTPTPPKF